jgi:cardiolipin synthase
MNFTSVFLLFCLILPVCSAVTLVEFCPDTYLSGDPDEYIVLEGKGNLDGITISDGEGGYRFPPGTLINGRITIAHNGSAYTLVHHRPPDFEFRDYSYAIPDVIASGNFQLANSKDELMLYENNRLVQKVSWPDDVHAREGQVHYLEDGVWDKRVLMIGQSRFMPGIFYNISGTCFVTPDCSREVYLETIEAAENEILVNVYEFTSQEMADALVRAERRGVNVTVLLEGGPVGGISPDEKAVCYALASNNIPVFLMGTQGVSHAPYRFNHAKYVVVDSCMVFITSENFTDNGFPETGKSGNRGWGIRLDDPGVASCYRELFLFDLNGNGISKTTGKPGAGGYSSAGPHTKEFQATNFTGMRVTPVIAPDTSFLVMDLIKSAREEIVIEQAYISNETDGNPNPYLSEAINASRHGVRVRVLLDSYWFNTDGEDDNDEMAAYINQVAISGRLPLEARCAALDANEIEKIHNKGVIVDSEKVLISSINWNYNSPTFNREAGVIIEHPGAGKYFQSAFEDDWQASIPVGPAGKNNTGYLKFIIAGFVIAGLIVLYWKRRN